MAFDTSTAAKLKIFNVELPGAQVTFDLNPSRFNVKKEQWTVDKAQSGSGSKSGAAPSPKSAASGFKSLFLGTKPTVVDFTALLSNDSGIKARCDMLLSWTQPDGSMAGKAIAAIGALSKKFQVTSRPPLLTLQWGDQRGFLMLGHLRTVSLTYKRFDSKGNPIRAEVSCTFQEASNQLLSMMTNPTSGGVPGWRAHVLTQGESLPALGVDVYGQPQAWRQIAEANGIDDPLRVRPGHRLRLPPPAEIAG